MDERQFYIERPETKNLTLVCPHCRQENSYPIRWMVRTKKKELPRGGGSEDRKRFELTGQSVVLVSESGSHPGGKPGPDFDPENFGNR